MARAFLKPARTRSAIKLRSNSATAPKTVKTILPVGVEVSICSENETKVALKGRAWIAAGSFQIVRLETDLIAPLPQIRLVADHATIEYGPVHFKSRNLDMWLPQNAEVHYDWKGRRSHRRHSFKNYLLFSVDEKQRISAPKDASKDDN